MVTLVAKVVNPRISRCLIRGPAGLHSQSTREKTPMAGKAMLGLTASAGAAQVVTRSQPASSTEHWLPGPM